MFDSTPRHKRWLTAMVLVLGATCATPGTARGEDKPQPDAKARPSAMRLIELPREGVSIVLPPKWKLNQYGESVLSAEQGDSQLWMYEGDDEKNAEAQLTRHVERLNIDTKEAERVAIKRVAGKGAEMFLQAWYVEGDEQRVMAVCKRIDGVAYHLEGRAPAKQAKAIEQLRAMLKSINVTPYQHPSRHVDWKNDWTMDVPATWSPEGTEDDEAKWAAPDDAQCTIRVFPVGNAQAGETPEEAEGRARSMIDDAVRRIRGKGMTMALKGDVEGTVQKMAEGPAASVARAHYVGTGTFMGKIDLLFEALVLDGVGTLTAAGATKTKLIEEARTITSSLRRGTHPGPRAQAESEKKITKFPVDRGPALRFVLPRRWSFTAPANSMRLAQIQIPGQPALWGTVYWFGKGQGGSKDDNMKRWRGHVGGEGATHEESTLKVNEQIQVHTLKASGTYQAPLRPGQPGKENQAGYRMITSFIDLPGGPITTKFAGPERVVKAMEAAYDTWLRSFTLAQESKKDGDSRSDAKPDESKKDEPKKEPTPVK